MSSCIRYILNYKFKAGNIKRPKAKKKKSHDTKITCNLLRIISIISNSFVVLNSEDNEYHKPEMSVYTISHNTISLHAYI